MSYSVNIHTAVIECATFEDLQRLLWHLQGHARDPRTIRSHLRPWFRQVVFFAHQLPCDLVSR